MERLPLCFFLLLSTLSIANVHSLNTEKIVGGQLANKSQFPYHVSVEVFGSTVCGGAIINETHVVTAAHCVMNKRTHNFFKFPYKVVGATLDVEKKDSTHQKTYVDKIYVPKRYTEPYKTGTPLGDIAVLKLKKPLNLTGSSYLSKVDLPTPGETYVNRAAVITGYGYDWIKLEKNNDTGKMEETGGGTSGKLRYANTTVLSTARCQQNYKWSISDDQLCARVKQHDKSSPEGICSGDSGGPLVYDNRVLIGVVSNSPIGCRENIAAAVYTRVSSFLGFVDKALRDVDDPEILTRVIPPPVLDDLFFE